MIPKEVSSLQHPIVKTFVKLRTLRKFRYAQKRLVIAGMKQVSEAPAIEVLMIRKGFSFGKSATEIYYVTDEILKKITGLESPEPVAAIVKMPPWRSLEGKKKIVVFDGIADPGNLGTLLRTALALGWEGAFLTEDCVDPFNDKALRAAKGATFSLPLRMGTSEELLELIKDYHSFVADMHGTPLPEVKPKEKVVLILGNEAKGVSEKLKLHCGKVAVPIAHIESLNVAAAGAILMYILRSA
ncbi:MAG: RNA methyltransferase [Verrucomicrobia bacterium]|nr:RNA methyltransferase [Verrucomicrobiota bacterium]